MKDGQYINAKMISNSKMASSSQNEQYPVYVNVYNFWSCFNRLCQPMGIGVYHTGIQLYDYEYMFFGFDGEQTGVGFIQPETAVYEFSEKILIGYTTHTIFQLDDYILDPLRTQFTGNKYDLLANNCNHFAIRLAKQLKLEHNFPKKIFRITDCCNLFRCCIPQCILNGRLDWFILQNSSDGLSEYLQLKQSVNEQFDLKMINQNKQNQKVSIRVQEAKSYGSRENSRLKFIEEHPDFPKHTTLRKGIWPHTQHVHERQSVPNASHLNSRFSSMQKTKRYDSPNQNIPNLGVNKYPNQKVRIFLNEKTENEKIQE